MHTLRVKETKVNLRTSFIEKLFALESDVESKNDERTLF